MTQVIDSEKTAATPESPKVMVTNPLALVVVVALIAIVGLLGAVIAMASANGFSFGDLAAVAAGENPPRDVSLQVASLLMWQDYSNAWLTGVTLALLLLFVSWGLDGSVQDSIRKRPWKLIQSLFVAVIIGGGCLTLACLAFRIQQVGTQDLVSAALIHSSLWAGLGVIVAQATGKSSQSGWEVPLPVLAGCLWGASFPLFVALVYPGAHAERLFASNGLIGLWGGIGSAVLLTSGLVEKSRRQKSVHIETASEVIQ